MTTEISTEAMLAELTITFPALWKRPLSEFGKAYAGKPGVWTGADTRHVMQDGEPIFQRVAVVGEPPYINGPVHQAFEAWLEAKGWTWELYDDGRFHLLPSSSFDWLDAGLQEHGAAVTQNAVVDPDPCPF